MRQVTSRIRALAGVATLVAVATPAAAQGPGRGAGPLMRGNIAGYLVQHPQALSLSDEQTARLRTIASWLDQSDSSLRGQIRAALGGRSVRGMNAEQRYQLMRQIRPLTEQLRANRLATVDSLHAVLSAEQFQQLADRRLAARAWGRGYLRGFARGRFGFRGRPRDWGPWMMWRRPA